ncbi:hypothetical protein Tco_0008940 [Tanacetum coccineum]
MTYIMAAYKVPPSHDYIPGPEVLLSPDYIPGPKEPQSPPHCIWDCLDFYSESDQRRSREEDDEDPEEDPADYPADRDDDDDEDEDEDEEEEEEHPAPADSVPPVHRMTARISIRDEPSISLPPREEVERLLALTTPPPSPLTPLSSPLPQIPSPPLPIPSPPPNSPTHIEIPESCLPLRKRVRFASPTPSHEVGESSAAGAARQDRPTIARDDPYSIAREDLYGFVDIRWGAVSIKSVTNLATIVEEETTSMYGIMEDAQDDRSQLRGRVNMLYRDRPVHRRLAVMIEREAKMAREAWGLSMDASDYARSDVMSLCTTVVGGRAHLILELQSEDHRRHESYVHFTGDKMAPREAHDLRPQCNTNTRTRHSSTTSVTNAQIQAMINEGVTRTGSTEQLEIAMITILHERVPEGLCKSHDQRFQELALMCDRMFPEEIDQVEKYVGGLPDTIHGSVMATKPKTMQDAIEFATELMDKKINTMLNVRRQQNKESPKCQHWGYQRLVLNWCSEHSKKDCPKLKNNNNRVIRPGNAKGSAKVYAVGQCGVTPDNNVDTANITATKDEDKSKEKRLEDVPVVQEFPEVFPKTCHNIPTPLDRVELPNQLELTEKGFIRQVSLPGELQVLFCEKNRWVFRMVEYLFKDRSGGQGITIRVG